MTYHEAGFGPRPLEDPYPGRRQLDQLTGEELRRQPVWWFPGPDGHLGGPDAATVMPVDASAAGPGGAAEFPPGRYLLHAVFTLADGAALDGHVTYEPGDRGTLADREPTLCPPGGQVPLWHGVLEPDPRQVQAFLAALGRPRSAVFPLTWATTLHPEDAPVAGSAQGFAVWRAGQVVWL
jgi:hypothetical protein